MKRIGTSIDKLNSIRLLEIASGLDVWLALFGPTIQLHHPAGDGGVRAHALLVATQKGASEGSEVTSRLKYHLYTYMDVPQYSQNMIYVYPRRQIKLNILLIQIS